MDAKVKCFRTKLFIAFSFYIFFYKFLGIFRTLKLLEDPARQLAECHHFLQPLTGLVILLNQRCCFTEGRAGTRKSAMVRCVRPCPEELLW